MKFKDLFDKEILTETSQVRKALKIYYEINLNLIKPNQQAQNTQQNTEQNNQNTEQPAQNRKCRHLCDWQQFKVSVKRHCDRIQRNG